MFRLIYVVNQLFPLFIGDGVPSDERQEVNKRLWLGREQDKRPDVRLPGPLLPWGFSASAERNAFL